ncbi:MAG TPA: winged helix-turn-helix domain-containing protein [Marmoricola sp.]
MTRVHVQDEDLTLDTATRSATRAGREIRLTAREFDLLHYFITHPGEVLTREELLREVWGWSFGDPSTVTVHVRRLREKVEDDPGRPERLLTVWGVGYRWETSAGR